MRTAGTPHSPTPLNARLRYIVLDNLDHVAIRTGETFMGLWS
jgi:hypothetical protein